MNFENFVREGNEFINEVAVELKDPQNKDRAGRVTKSVLHAVRDQLDIHEAMHLAAQLPMAIKAVYVDNWNISENPKKSRSLNNFVDYMREMDNVSADVDFPNRDEAIIALRAVFNVLARHITKGQMQHVKGQLTKEVAEVII